ncbi:class I SAM-dependent methyltransferase [Paenibacillus montanisoli]|uniref:Class I SAM-dependent methyltransferase n=1 Tax=Paenibacillus montanisoli TaxID=2081970 RepID=A0A328U8G3_9BACL|nr:class I SAM-dependent methyltransferase [Paenibacillus montanisoli]RAP78113.1 class I SAM-dependent methyltransferase [Paenibacillus montanisoli]
MPDHDSIYQFEAERYERLVSREDVEGNLLKTIRKIVPDASAMNAADIGAGTGRVTALLAPLVRSVTAIDSSAAMLERASLKLSAGGYANWQTKAGSHDCLPLETDAIDLLTAGWTICYCTSSTIEDWREQLDRIMTEIRRVLKPGGTAIIFENFGTGSSVPNPPDFLTGYFAALEMDYDFHHEAIRTDYRFESFEEALALTGFFFGDWLADIVSSSGSRDLPEWTGVWWRRFD